MGIRQVFELATAKKSIWTFLLIVWLQTVAYAQFFSTKIYRLDDGIPSNSVYDIVQTPDLKMWFLSPQGIFNYNSVEWNLVPDSVGLPFSAYSRLQVDPGGTLWAAGQNDDGFVVYYLRKKEWTRLPLPDTVPFPTGAFSFEGPASDRDSTIVWTAQKRLYLYDFGKRVLHEIDSLPFGQVNSIARGSTGRLLATERGLFHWDEDSIYASEINQNLHQDHQELLTARVFNGKIYLLGRNWIGYIEDGKKKVLSEQLNESENNYKKYNLVVDSLGRIFFSSQSKPKFYDPEEKYIEPLEINQIDFKYLSNRIFLDKESNLWVGDHRGLFKFSIFGFLSYTSENGLIENEVTSVRQMGDTMVIANPQHLNFYIHGKVYQGPQLPEVNPAVRILDLEYDRRGGLLIASNRGGALRYKDGRFEPVHRRIEDFYCRAIEPYRDGFVYATSGGVFYVAEDQSLEKINNQKSVRNIIVLNDTIYLCKHSNGITRISDNGKVAHYKSDELQLSSTYDVVEWKGEIWLATDAGVAKIDRGKIEKVDLHPDLEDVSAYSLMTYTEKQLIIGTNLGIYYWDGQNLRAYNKKNGLHGTEINRNAVLKDSNGQLWVGTESGVSYYREKLDKFEAVPTLRIIEVVGSDGKVIMEPDSTIPYSKRNVQINYAGISYINEDLVEYSYYLDGFEQSWSSPSTAASVRYANLDPGDYVFRIRSRFSGFRWGTTQSIAFTVVRPYYQTWWFQMIVLILLSLLVILLFRLRFIYLIRSREKLKAAVNERTADLALKNRAIEEQNKELKANQDEITSINRKLKTTIADLKNAQQRLIQAEKMASLGILSSGISHEFNNPLNFILHGVHLIDKRIRREQDIEQRSFDELFEIVYTGIDRVSTIVDSLNEFSNTSSEQEDCDIHEILEKSILFVSGKGNGKLDIRKRFAAEKHLIYGNKSKIYQVMVNVLSNAVDAAGMNGKIDIATASNKTRLKIMISDNGPGISQDILSKIFDPFFSTKDPGKGTGLGLSIAYSIVEEHQGEIDVQSTSSLGTTISIELPCYGE